MSTLPNSAPPAFDPPASTAVVVLSPEQTRAAWLELRDDQGLIVGYLARQQGASHFISLQEMEILRNRAENPPAAGKSLAEILATARSRIKG